MKTLRWSWLLLIGMSSAQAMLVDGFSAAPILLQLQGPSDHRIVHGTDPQGATILGGVRTLSARLDGDSDANAQVDLSVSQQGNLVVNNGLAAATTATLRWDGGGTGLGGVDLTAWEATGVYVGLDALVAGFALGLGIADTDGLISVASWTFDQAPEQFAATPSAAGPIGAAGGPTSGLIHIFAYPELRGTADLTSVDAIWLTLSGPTGWSANLSFISTDSFYIPLDPNPDPDPERDPEREAELPVPATLPLLALGGLVLTWQRHRRRP